MEPCHHGQGTDLLQLLHLLVTGQALPLKLRQRLHNLVLGAPGYGLLIHNEVYQEFYRDLQAIQTSAVGLSLRVSRYMNPKP